MVVHVHSILDQVLVGIIVQIVGEGDRVLFRKCHHRYAMAGGVKVAHINDRSIPLVEGASTVDDRLGGIRTWDKLSRRRLLPLHRDDE